jgi:hypothetical protein
LTLLRLGGNLLSLHDKNLFYVNEALKLNNSNEKICPGENDNREDFKICIL